MIDPAPDHEYVAREVRTLAGTDSYDSIARRLGYSDAKSLSRLLYRWGYRDLGQSVEHLEPLYPRLTWTPR